MTVPPTDQPLQSPTLRRRLQLWRNRMRIGYRLKREGWRIRVFVPAHHRKWIVAIKAAVTVTGLVSAFIIFGSVWYAFLFGFGLYVLQTILEKTAFVHYAGFLHAVPWEELDPDLWVGISFGTVGVPGVAGACPGLAMVVTDRVYAERMSRLILAWTEGELDDKDKNVGVSIVELSHHSYVFLCFPRMTRHSAQDAYAKAKAKLRERSLEDELALLHGITVFGKRCELLEDSPYPSFAASYRPGQPIMLGFGMPRAQGVEILNDVPAVRIHTFRIVSAKELTRKDFEKEAMKPFISGGGKWQGPPDRVPLGRRGT